VVGGGVRYLGDVLYTLRKGPIIPSYPMYSVLAKMGVGRKIHCCICFVLCFNIRIIEGGEGWLCANK